MFWGCNSVCMKAAVSIVAASVFRLQVLNIDQCIYCTVIVIVLIQGLVGFYQVKHRNKKYKWSKALLGDFQVVQWKVKKKKEKKKKKERKEEQKREKEKERKFYEVLSGYRTEKYLLKNEGNGRMNKNTIR